MERSEASLAQIAEVPNGSLILVTGSPGAGKSTFCHRMVLNSLATDRPVIFATTEQRPAQVLSSLQERGLGRPAPEALRFVDAFSQTVGVAAPERQDTIQANCLDLNSISIAITRLQGRMGQKGILLAFDSLTSPYLFSGAELVKFIRLFLSKFAAEGNAVLAVTDEGCGRPEDLGAMMSIANGVIRLEMEEDRQLLSVVKHPTVRPARIEIPVSIRPRVISAYYDPEYARREVEMAMRGVKMTLRPEAGDLINVAWRGLVFWSGMLWDPKRFPTMMYELTKHSEDPTNYDIDIYSLLPWHSRLLFRLLMPKSFSKVKDVKKTFERVGRPQYRDWRIASLEYLDGVSNTDEHHVRLGEHYECWGLEKVGASLALMRPAMHAGIMNGFEELAGLERDWNVVETKCIGLGDHYCEFRFVPEEPDDMRASLEKDSTVIERVQERLMEHILGFLLHGQPLMERPTLGSGVHIHEIQHVTVAPLVNERLRMVFSMGGARAGKVLGERLLESGLGKQDAMERVFGFLEHCKVGKITLRPGPSTLVGTGSGLALGETIRMKENCERFGIRTDEPSCYFTTGFFNGFFSAVKNQHVRETRCIAAGDPYCEWEIF